MLGEMRMSTACFACAAQRCIGRLSKPFLLTFQEVTPLSKTRNQLLVNILGEMGPLKLIAIVLLLADTLLVMEGDHTANGLK